MHQGAYRRCSLSLILFLVIFSMSDIDSQLREYVSNLTKRCVVTVQERKLCFFSVCFK